MNEMTHERCSELLRAFVSDELDTGVSDDVRHHLAGCEECRLELTALEAMAGPAIEPLNGTERDTLTQAVRAAISTPPRATFAERFGRRFAPAVGAVAFIAIAIIGFVILPRSNDSPQEISAPQLQTANEAADDDAAGGGVDRSTSTTMEADSGAGSTGSGTGAGTTSDTADHGQAAPALNSAKEAGVGFTLEGRMAFEVQRQSFARHGLDVRSLVPRGVPQGEVADAFAYDLADSAPNGRIARLVRDCSERTVSTSPHPLIPTSAAYYSDDVLVISFVWLESSTTSLNYEIWGWTNGRCDHVSPIYRRGLVE